MADNVTSSAGTGDGAVFAADLIGTVYFPRVKLTIGSDGVNDGDVCSALPLPIAGAVTNDGTFAVQAAQSGTWNITNISGTVSLPTGAATAAKQPALGTAGVASADAITVQGIASMTPLLATATLSAETTKIIGAVNNLPATVDTNSGVKSASTLRVVLATDQPALTNKLLVTPDSVALPANQSVNVSQINGVTPLMGTGVMGTGSPRVTIASDNDPLIVKQATAGDLNVTAVLAAGSTVQPVPGTTGGLSVSYATSAASNNKTQAKATAGQLYFISIQSIHSAPVYLKIFNNTSAGVSAGTTAADYQFMCPANSTAANGAGVVFNFDSGIAMSTGITWMLTTGIGATDNTSTAANIAVVTLGYK